MNTLNETSVFSVWFLSIKDAKTKSRIIPRLNMARQGNFGDYAFVGDGVFEMRLHFGTGYRIYYAQQEKQVYLLLAGGDKNSQQKDIAQAKKMFQFWKENKYGFHN